jgi:hypothetical protein
LEDVFCRGGEGKTETVEELLFPKNPCFSKPLDFDIAMEDTFFKKASSIGESFRLSPNQFFFVVWV